ncbi:hypothetical protein C8Q74DRAFT_1261137 [Fomes fomentarius]|nr:hypothetical protein C8Q74DRAFT_1261137 [Fomes fomentarius]
MPPKKSGSNWNSSSLFGNLPPGGTGGGSAIFGQVTPVATPVAQATSSSPTVASDSKEAGILKKRTQSALERSITTGIFIDTRFSLFSCRTRDGASVSCPLPVYANSEVLVEVAEYFKTLLSGGFAESCEPMHVEGTREALASEYGYESDSDLEDEATDVPHALGDLSGEKEKESTVKPSIGIDDQDGLVVRGRDVESSEPGPPSNLIPVRHSVLISDASLRTFKALLAYTYTGEINFAPLRSRRDERCSKLPSLTCSPKSMYRLADKYGMTALKTLAFNNLRSQMTPSIALRELFSRFTSRYPDIINMEAQYITNHCNDPACLSELSMWMDMAVNGDLPHVSIPLVTLIRKLSNATGGSSTRGSGFGSAFSGF